MTNQAVKCSFCGASKHETEILSGPTAHICDVCIGAAKKFMQDKQASLNVELCNCEQALQLAQGLNEIMAIVESRTSAHQKLNIIWEEAKKVLRESTR